MKNFVPLAAALTLTACAGAVQIGPAGPDATPPDGPIPPNEILITRPSGIDPLTTATTTPVILVDGQEVGTCEVGKPVLLRLDDGAYEISAKTNNGSASQWVTVENFAQIDMVCDATGILRPQPVLQISPPT